MRSGASASAERSALPRLLVVLSLFLLLGTLPPEVHGESLAGAALLLVVLALAPGPRAGTRLLAALPVAALAGMLLARAAEAPGAAVEPLLIGLLGVAAAAYTRSLAAPLTGDDRVPWTLAITGGIAGTLAVHEKLFGLARLAAAVESTPALPDRDLVLARIREGRAYGAFPTPAALGCFLAMTAAVTWSLAVSRKGRARAVLLALAAIQGAGIVATMSATAAGALAVAVALSLLRGRATRGATLAVLGAAGTLLLAVVATRGTRVLSIEDPASPWKQRAGNARVALEVIGDHPWLGVGPGGFGEVYPKYRHNDDNESRHVHDLPLELGAELGLPLGLFVAAAFFLAFLRPVLERPRDGAPAWHRGAAVALAAFAIQNLGDFTAFLPSLLWTACLLWGVTARRDDGSGADGALPRRAALAATVGLALVAVAAGIADNARTDARGALAAGDVESAKARTARAAALAPWNVDVLMLRAQLSLDAKDPRAASRQADRAVAVDPIRPAARELRSRVRLAAGDLPGAYADLVEAARLYPGRTEYASRRDELGRLLSAVSVRPGEAK